MPHRECSIVQETGTHLKGSAIRPGLITDAMFFRVCKTSAFRERPPFVLTKVAPLAAASAPGFAASFPADGAALSLPRCEPLLSSVAAHDALAGDAASFGLVLA